MLRYIFGFNKIDTIDEKIEKLLEEKNDRK